MGYNSTAEGRLIFEGIIDEKLALLNTEILEGVVKSALINEWQCFQPHFRIQSGKIIAYSDCYGKLYDLKDEIQTVVSALVKATGATSVTGHIMRTGEDPTDIELYRIAQTTPTVSVEASRAESIVFRNGVTVPLR